jgi:hypothetical protein
MYCLKIAIFLILGQICFSKSVPIEEDNMPSECQPDWYNTCHSNEECCSGTCYTNNGQWKDGLCTPKDNASQKEEKERGEKNELPEISTIYMFLIYFLFILNF